MNTFAPNPLRGLLIAQFFGAFNDNAWKLMVALLAIKQLAAQMGTGLAYESAAHAQTTMTFVVFTLPLVVVSIFAGVFSDRFSKRVVIVVMKALEVVLMGGALFQSRGRGVAINYLRGDGCAKCPVQSGEVWHFA